MSFSQEAVNFRRTLLQVKAALVKAAGGRLVVPDRTRSCPLAEDEELLEYYEPGIGQVLEVRQRAAKPAEDQT